ncbi:hypothetical protein V8C42DRAFT_334601 [Trichoderma barbatum]
MKQKKKKKKKENKKKKEKKKPSSSPHLPASSKSYHSHSFAWSNRAGIKKEENRHAINCYCTLIQLLHTCTYAGHFPPSSALLIHTSPYAYIPCLPATRLDAMHETCPREQGNDGILTSIDAETSPHRKFCPARQLARGVRSSTAPAEMQNIPVRHRLQSPTTPASDKLLHRKAISETHNVTALDCDFTVRRGVLEKQPATVCYKRTKRTKRTRNHKHNTTQHKT